MKHKPETHTVPQFPSYEVVSQTRYAINPALRQQAEARYLPVLVKVWRAVELATGHRWMSTSYWRDSPSHQHGIALDIAPDIEESAKPKYAVTKMSDPILYKREPLIRALQTLVSTSFDPEYHIGIFIEPDHLHIQFIQSDSKYPTEIIKWGDVKPLYPDSIHRVKLGLIK